MKLVRIRPGYASKTIVARLEESEVSLPDDVLVMMADGHSRASAQEVHDSKSHPGHFGYRDFERRKNSSRKTYIRVTIHTD